MIREIINFTKDLIEDLPEIVNLNNKPQEGLYVFIDINESGEWTNQDLRTRCCKRVYRQLSLSAIDVDVPFEGPARSL